MHPLLLCIPKVHIRLKNTLCTLINPQLYPINHPNALTYPPPLPTSTRIHPYRKKIRRYVGVALWQRSRDCLSRGSNCNANTNLRPKYRDYKGDNPFPALSIRDWCFNERGKEKGIGFCLAIKTQFSGKQWSCFFFISFSYSLPILLCTKDTAKEKQKTSLIIHIKKSNTDQ